MISCPICGQRVSTMAGTCPHCGTHISGHLRICPSCGVHCHRQQETCPACHAALPAFVAEEKEEKPKVAEVRRKRPRNFLRILWTFLKYLIFLALACAVAYYLYLRNLQEVEEEEFRKLGHTTNPAYYEDFIQRHPESPHIEDVRKRMLYLQGEIEVWQKALKSGSREDLEQFMEVYPSSVRIRMCRDKIDSIDWAEAIAERTDSSINAYIGSHPEGMYLNEALETKKKIAKARRDSLNIK